MSIIIIIIIIISSSSSSRFFIDKTLTDAMFITVYSKIRK